MKESDFDITKYHKCLSDLYWFGCYEGDSYFKQYFEPSTYCFDIQTEILTENGWKTYDNLKEKENVATLNPLTHKLEYQPIKEVVLQKYKGMMYYLKCKQIDIMVTPNHRLYLGFQTKNYNLRGKKLRFVTAEKQFGKIKIFKKDCIWEGKNEEYFTLPTYQKFSSKDIPMKVWLAFFGLWIAEGSISGKYSVNISNNNLNLLEEIKNRIRLWFKPHIYRHGDGWQLVICNIQLINYLNQFKGAENKFVPQEIKQLSSKLLNRFLDYYLKGDGSRRMVKGGKNLRTDAWTISKKLCDDLLEIALKIGISANFYSRDRIGITKTDYKNKKYTTRHIEYCINFTHQNTPQINNKQHKSNIEKWIDYSGLVWCVVTDNGLIYVRRNGKTYWSGNSHPAKISPLLADRIFKHLEKLELLKEGMTILDFMSGSGRVPLLASLRGYKSIGVELEPHFVKMCNDNKKFAENKIGRKLDMEIVQGDSRQLSKLLSKSDVAVVSPPFSDMSKPERKLDKTRLKNNRFRIADNYSRKEMVNHLDSQTDSQMVGVVSPPYQDSIVNFENDAGKKRVERLKQAGFDRKNSGMIRSIETKSEVNAYKGFSEGYSQNPENIGNLKDTGSIVGITSPPYVDAPKENRVTKNKAYEREGRINVNLHSKYFYRESKHSQDNIANLKDTSFVGITSPPYDNRLRNEGDEERRNFPTNSDKFKATYPANENNLGNQIGQNYLSAMLQVYREAYKVCPVLVTITKNPTRRGVLRRLDLDTLRLLELAGYSVVDFHRAMLFKDISQQTLSNFEREEKECKHKMEFWYYDKKRKIAFYKCDYCNDIAVKHHKGRLSFFKRNSLNKGNVAAMFEDILIGVKI